MPDWTVVVPVKGTASAKSRFGGPADARAALARAMALDTVEAVLRALRVTAVIVVTASDDAAQFESLGAMVVREEPGAGLLAAIGVGLIGMKAAEAVGRNPGAATPILIQSILSTAFAEGIVFFALFLGRAPVV